MKAQRSRLAVLLALVVAALGAFAGAAQAATPVVAYTGPGVAGGPTGEYLTGAVNTYGAQTYYQFEYGTTTSYGSKTPVETIPAGRSIVIVYFPVTKLKPNTTYHFRLDAEPTPKNAYGYYYGLPGTGADVTFKTTSAGKIVLGSTKLKVKKGKAGLSLKCSSTIVCAGRYSATVKAKVKGKTKTVTCFSGRFSLKPNATGNYSPKVSKSCLALFKHHKLSGVTLTVTTTTYQPRLTRKVTLST